MNLKTNPLDGLQTAVLHLDAHGAACELNAAAQAMLGAARHVAGWPLAAWFVDDETLRKLVQHIEAQQEDVCRGLLHVRRAATGESSLVHVVLSPATGGYLLECYPLGAFEHVQQDTQWRAQVNNHQLLMRQLAHEIKNPLGGIRGAAQLLHNELADMQPDLMEYTEMMLGQVDRLKNLVDQFLVPYRHSARQAGALNVHEVCETVLQLVQMEFATPIQWVRDYDVSVPDVLGVADYVQQLLLNLLQNAAQAIERGGVSDGKITVRTRVARQVLINQQVRPLMLELSVIDNGPGVPAQIYDTLFLPMVTQREGGTGLGLSVAMQIAQQHGGNIEAHSRAGLTHMRVLLPLDLTQRA
ncbi:MAG: nitrogen regulation protein NR(II) [Formosimonas sp.]